MIRVAVIASGAAEHRVAEAVREGAVGAGADVRLRRAGEVMPDDVDWADACVFGAAGREGAVAAAGPGLAGKVASGFTAAAAVYGGRDPALLALYAALYDRGAIVVASGDVVDGGLDAARRLGARVTAMAARLGAPVPQ